MKIIIVLIAIAAVSGCATWDHQKERRELLRGPKTVNLADAHGFTESKKDAQTNYALAVPKDAGKAEIARFVDEAIAAQTLNCRDYFREVTLASRKGQLARSDFNIGASIVTALSAMWHASAEFLAALGIAVAGVNQLGDAYADTLIEAPDTPAVRGKVLETMDQYATQLRADAAVGITYPQARVRLAAHEDICSPGSVRELVNASVRQSTASVTPAGTLQVKQ